jgi:hypothetical protein
MQLYLIPLFLAFTIASALTGAPAQKAVMVSYGPDVPDSVLDQAKEAVKQAGGVITHEFSTYSSLTIPQLSPNTGIELIKGFAANAPAEVLNSIEAWGTEYKATVEEDQTVHALGDGS